MKVAVIGLGNMGKGMAMCLHRSGFDVFGYDAVPATRDQLAKEGLPVVESIAEAVVSTKVILLSLPTAAVVESVVLGAEGIATHAAPGSVIVDTSTSDPQVTRRLASALQSRGIGIVDAPVTGGPAGAAQGTLTMVLGGDSETIDQILPALNVISAKRVHVGDVGAGHIAKIANNMLVGAHLVVAAEVLKLAEAAGVDPRNVLLGINAGSGRSFVTENNYPKWILGGNFDSGFTMKLMRKDVALGMSLAGALDVRLPALQLLSEIWAESTASVNGEADFNRITEFVRQGEHPAPISG